ncbi:MAG: porin family protein [Chitinophagaceae bacterium]
MKKAILIVLIVSASATVFAQNEKKMTTGARFGIHAGANFANVKEKVQGSSSTTENSLTRLNAGVFVELPIVPSFAIQPEVNYSGMGAKVKNVDGAGTDINFLEDYISIPVLLKFKVPTSGFGIYIAPQYSFLMSAKSKVSGGSSTDVKSDYKSGEFSGLVGAEYFLPVGVGISARYQAGFSNVLKQAGSGSVKNHAFTVTIGYRF